MSYYLVSNAFRCAIVKADDVKLAKRKFEKAYKFTSKLADLRVIPITPTYIALLSGIEIIA